jgi:hypothetical protein
MGRWLMRGLVAQIITAALLSAGLAAAQAPQLELPLRCAPGRDCWIVNYVDADPGPGVRDFACGRQTYDGHNGTDFAIRDLKAMQEGVPVLAAAAGVVRGVRDGEPDVNVRERGRASVKDRECGNAVRVEHAGGLQTLYCHMRKGSVAVKQGDAVSAGTVLGMVGMSGLAEIPHLHFTVLAARKAIDPFVGHSRPASGCGAGEAPLWRKEVGAALAYRRGSLYNYGVASEAPKWARAKAGDYRARRLSASEPVLALWVEAFSVAPGDALEIELNGPDGQRVLAQRFGFERTQVQVFRSLARRVEGGWPRGKYHVKITYHGEALSTADFDVEIH